MLCGSVLDQLQLTDPPAPISTTAGDHRKSGVAVTFARSGNAGVGGTVVAVGATGTTLAVGAPAARVADGATGEVARAVAVGCAADVARDVAAGRAVALASTSTVAARVADAAAVKPVPEVVATRVAVVDPASGPPLQAATTNTTTDTRTPSPRMPVVRGEPPR